MRNLVAYADAIYNYAYAARLCPDVLLKAFGTAYPVHRVILASQSAYFATLLRWVSWQPRVSPRAEDEPQWSGLPSHDLVLGEDVTQRGFEWILEYFYASPHLAISSDNAFDVLAAAHYLGVAAVQTACVEFLSQHLDPDNFTACLMWATRADHGDASDMLAASCRRLLALHLPRNLPVWAPALPYIEPRTLLDILSSDYLAVPTEYDRYELVKEVASLLAPSTEPTAADAPRRPDGVAPGGGDGNDGGSMEAEAEAMSRGNVPSGREVAGSAAGGTYGGLPYRRPAGGAVEVQHMLSSALNTSDQQGLARHLRLARSRSASAWPQLPWGSAASPTAGAAAAPSAAGQRANWCLGGGGCSGAAAARRLPEGGEAGDSGDSGAPGGSCAGPFSPVGSSSGAVPSDCHEDCSTTPESVSQASSRSTVRLSDHKAPEDVVPVELGGGNNGNCGCDRTPGEGRGAGGCGYGYEGTPGEGQQAAAAATEGAHAVEPVGTAAEPAVGGGGAPAAAAAPAGAECGAAAEDPAELARLLLHEAVRYEHLTVPQLMAVQLEGLVAPPVLHTALWERTRLDYQLHIRAVAPAAPAADGGGHGRHHAAARAIGLLSAPLSYGVEGTAPCGGGSGRRQEGAGRPEVQRSTWQGQGQGRPFRICWRLSCRALKKLQPGGMLQSEPHQYAGAVWLLRLCCGDGTHGHLGLYVGRQLAASSAGSQGSHRPPGNQGHVGNPAPGPAGHNRQRPPPQHNRLPPPLLPPRASPSPPAAAVASANSYFSYTDSKAAPRGRCRVSMYQPDNTALQGRLCLGDSGDFTADFAAGGYFGRARLVPREDVLGLRDEAELLAFVSLQALVGDADSGE